jgi:hypothetical protein
VIVVPVSRNAARAFVREHHRHGIRPPSSEVLRAGLELDGQLVAVGTAGMPCRELMDGYTIEVARVCTLGDRNACSQLYGALCRAAKALGWRRAVTYTLASESGSSVRAAGFTLDAQIAARSRQIQSGARPRYQTNLLGENVAPEEPRLRWSRLL